MSLEHLREWVERTSGLPTIWMYQSAPRPNRPYLGIEVEHVRRQGEEYISYVDDNGVQKIISHHDHYVTIHAFCENDFKNPSCATDVLFHLQNRLNVPSEYEWLYYNNVNVVRQHKVEPVPRIVSEGYQLRAFWRIVILLQNIEEDFVDSIDSVAITNLTPYNFEVEQVRIIAPSYPWFVTEPDVTIRGSGEPGNTITLGYDLSGSGTVDENGDWSINVTLPNWGTFEFTATDGNSTDVSALDYRWSPLQITEPVGGSVVSSPFSVKGVATPQTFIYVAGQRTYVDPHGRWEKLMALDVGAHTITVTDRVSVKDVSIEVQHSQ